MVNTARCYSMLIPIQRVLGIAILAFTITACIAGPHPQASPTPSPALTGKGLFLLDFDYEMGELPMCTCSRAPATRPSIQPQFGRLKAGDVSLARTDTLRCQSRSPIAKKAVKCRGPSNQAMEPTTSRRTILLYMGSTRQSAATRALARRSSSWFR